MSDTAEPAAPSEAVAPPPEPGAPPLLEVRGLAKYFGNVIALEDITHDGRGRQGDVRARRQRRRQVVVHQDPVRRAPARRRRGAARRRGRAVQVARATRSTAGSPPCTRTWPWCR